MVAVLDLTHVGDWTVKEWMELNESSNGNRYELLDGLAAKVVAGAPGPLPAPFDIELDPALLVYPPRRTPGNAR
jgi:hypothetical protein